MPVQTAMKCYLNRANSTFYKFYDYNGTREEIRYAYLIDGRAKFYKPYGDKRTK